MTDKSVESEMHAANYGICRKCKYIFYWILHSKLRSWVHICVSFLLLHGSYRDSERRSCSEIVYEFWICSCDFKAFICHTKDCKRRKILKVNENNVQSATLRTKLKKNLGILLLEHKMALWIIFQFKVSWHSWHYQKYIPNIYVACL